MWFSIKKLYALAVLQCFIDCFYRALYTILIAGYSRYVPR